jgi:hypothetical protein
LHATQATAFPADANLQLTVQKAAKKAAAQQVQKMLFCVWPWSLATTQYAVLLNPHLFAGALLYHGDYAEKRSVVPCFSENAKSAFGKTDLHTLATSITHWASKVVPFYGSPNKPGAKCRANTEAC